jgi:hypothetical protein
MASIVPSFFNEARMVINLKTAEAFGLTIPSPPPTRWYSTSVTAASALQSYDHLLVQRDKRPSGPSRNGHCAAAAVAP